VRPRVVIVGGYGLVGGFVARHIRAAGHDVDLMLAGRNPQQGKALARELGAATLRLDVNDPAAGLAERPTRGEEINYATWRALNQDYIVVGRVLDGGEAPTASSTSCSTSPSSSACSVSR